MTLSSESAERINLLYRAAKHNGSLVSIQELSRLLPENASESEVEEAISSIPQLNSRFELRSGYLTERVKGLDDPVQLETQSRRTARENLSHASRLASALRAANFEVVAVSGSTSYGSASLSKDADFFCVAPIGEMWLSLARSLLIARAYGVLNRGAPGFCLSCVMDDAYARSAFKSRRHPLFARDAIEARVLIGQGVYKSLMRSARWISNYYPVAYQASIANDSEASAASRPSAFARILNLVLYAVLGRYMLAKSTLLNRRLKALGRSGDVFSVRSGADHLIYESRRYGELRKEYESSEPASFTS